MKNYIILFFILLNFVLYSQSFLEETEYAIEVENIIYPESVLKISAPFVENLKFELISKPRFSESELLKKDEKYYLVPDFVGKYKIRMKTDSYDVFKEIIVNRKIKESEDVLYLELSKIKLENNQDLMTKKIKSILINYPESKSMIWYFLDYASGIEDRNEKIKYYKIVENNYILDSKTAEKIYLELYKRVYTESEKNQYLKKLYGLSNKYEKEYLLKSFEKSKGSIVKNLEKYYIKYLDKEIGKVLGDYYREMNNSQKALLYDNYSDKIKLAEYYFENEENELLDEIYYDLAEDEQKIIERKKLKKENEKILKGYYGKAKESLDAYKFELAQVYYNNILESSDNEKYLKKIYYDLGKLNFIRKDYAKSLLYFEKYSKEYSDSKDIELLYYFSRIYYEFDEDEESLKYLDQIIERSPYTVWETRAKIYMLKINKRRRDG